MSAVIQIGTPRIALLNTNGTKAKTLYLPPPDRSNGISLEWIEKAVDTTLVNGSESTRRLGWIPQITLSWSVYDDVTASYGYSYGSTDGHMASYSDLMTLLDNQPNTLKLSPGPTAGGMICNKITVSAVGVNQGLTTGLKIVFRGGQILSNKGLGSF